MKGLLATGGARLGGVFETSDRGVLIVTEGELCCAMEEFTLNDQLPMFCCEGKAGRSSYCLTGRIKGQRKNTLTLT